MGLDFGRHAHCRELIRVTVLKLGKERPQYADHDCLIVDDEGSLHHVRAALFRAQRALREAMPKRAAAS